MRTGPLGGFCFHNILVARSPAKETSKETTRGLLKETSVSENGRKK